MRVLVTGGMGFVGRAVVDTLSQRGDEVFVLSHTTREGALGDVPIIHADIRDRESLISAIAPLHVEAVCHLAGVTSVRDSFADPIGYFDTNLGGTANLLRALPKSTRVVMTSTSAVYGSARPGRLSEDLPPSAENPYAASKLAAEQLLAHVASTGAVGGITLRCFNISGVVHGYGDPDRTRIIPAVLRAAAGELDHVTVNGNGSAVREFTHVLDAADAIKLALDAVEVGGCRTFNLGTGNGVTMLDVIHAAEKATGRPIPVRHVPAAPEAHTLTADRARIRQALGWQPTRSSIERILRDAWTAKAPYLATTAHPRQASSDKP